MGLTPIPERHAGAVPSRPGRHRVGALHRPKLGIFGALSVLVLAFVATPSEASAASAPVAAPVNAPCTLASAALTPVVPAVSSVPLGGTFSGVTLNALQTTTASTIVDVGKKLKVTRRGIRIALAVAMQESSLNPAATSGPYIGLFQQRSDPSSGLYTQNNRLVAAGASTMFFQQLLKRVPGYQSDPRLDWEVGEVIQETNVGRNVEQWFGLSEALTARLFDSPMIALTAPVSQSLQPAPEVEAAPKAVTPKAAAPVTSGAVNASNTGVGFVTPAGRTAMVPALRGAGSAFADLADVVPVRKAAVAATAPVSPAAPALPGVVPDAGSAAQSLADAVSSALPAPATDSSTPLPTSAPDPTTSSSSNSSTAAPSSPESSASAPTPPPSPTSTPVTTAAPITTTAPSAVSTTAVVPTTSAPVTTRSSTAVATTSKSPPAKAPTTTTKPTTKPPTKPPTKTKSPAPTTAKPPVAPTKAAKPKPVVPVDIAVNPDPPEPPVPTGSADPSVGSDPVTPPVVAPVTPAGPTGTPAPIDCSPSTGGRSTSFDPGMIISDAVFYNTRSMSAADIRTFIAGKGASCTVADCLKSLKLSTPSQPADRYCAAYQGGAQDDVATVLQKLSVACGINPQVMLVTLQKESALLTRSDVTPRTYDAAYGWHCPDSGPGGSANCDPQYAGFFNQAYGMAKQWARYRVDPGKYNFHAGQTATILWNVAATGCGGSSVLIRNTATASLYNYTPYQPNAASLAAYPAAGDRCSSYGNRNFFFLFQKYFGTTGGGVDQNVYLNGVNVTIPAGPHVAAGAAGAVIKAPTAAVAKGLAAGFAAIGLPYVWGGGTNGGPADQGCARAGGTENSCQGIVGFDCSGLTGYVLLQSGVHIPDYSLAQRGAGKSVPWSAGQPGDIIGYQGHVAVYLGLIKGVPYLLEAPDVGMYVQVRPVYYANGGVPVDNVLHRYWG